MFISKKKHNKMIEEKQQQIEYRNDLIEYQRQKLNKLSSSETAKENKALREENAEQRSDIEDLKLVLRHIKELANTQQYGSVNNLQNKIKSELDSIPNLI